MRTRLIFAIGVFAILLSVGATAPVAAADTDACTLVTQAQLSAALSVPMDAGKHTTPTYVKTCTWVPTGGATKSLKFVTLNLESANGFEGGKSLAMATKEVVMTPASGIGDDAYFAVFGGKIVNLMVKKGSVSFKLAIYGASDIDKAMSMEKSIAQGVVSKL
jgi:hypothetical protein